MEKVLFITSLTMLLAGAVLIIRHHLKFKLSSLQAKTLRKLMQARRIKSRLEHWDGHKRVDLYVPAANLNIEIDGQQHFLDPEQILSDLKRDCSSCRLDRYTLRVPNFIVERHARELADTLEKVVKRLEAA